MHIFLYSEITPRIRIEESRVIITNAMINDTQVLQCVAKNEYGQIFTNVILDIQRRFSFKNKYIKKKRDLKTKHYMYLFEFFLYFKLIYLPPIFFKILSAPPKPQWAKWSRWTDCTLTCGNGVQHRTRNCTDLETRDDVTCVGQPMANQTCNTFPCPGKQINYENM